MVAVVYTGTSLWHFKELSLFSVFSGLLWVLMLLVLFLLFTPKYFCLRDPVAAILTAYLTKSCPAASEFQLLRRAIVV